MYIPANKDKFDPPDYELNESEREHRQMAGMEGQLQELIDRLIRVCLFVRSESVKDMILWSIVEIARRPVDIQAKENRDRILANLKHYEENPIPPPQETKQRIDYAVPTKLRFEILHRDKFTCKYCGRKAPDVELHVDHIYPASKGGTLDKENLTTACKDCNLGKKDTVLCLNSQN